MPDRSPPAGPDGLTTNYLVGDVVTIYSNNATGKPEWDSPLAVGLLQRVRDSIWIATVYSASNNNNFMAVGKYTGDGFSGWSYPALGNFEGSITKVANSSINTAMIADKAVTAAKLADSYFINRGSIADLNNAVSDGVYTFDIDALNSPFDRGSVFVTHASNNTVNAVQFAVGYESGNVNMILS